MARRVGSAKAEKAASRFSVPYIRIYLYKLSLIVKQNLQVAGNRRRRLFLGPFPSLAHIKNSAKPGARLKGKCFLKS